MGVRKPMFSDGASYRAARFVPAGNPDPKKFEILHIVQRRDFVIAFVQYPNCKNFEGNKILVWKGLTVAQVRQMEEMDPHFASDSELSPIARFRPTQEGFNLANVMADAGRAFELGKSAQKKP